MIVIVFQSGFSCEGYDCEGALMICSYMGLDGLIGRGEAGDNKVEQNDHHQNSEQIQEEQRWP